MHEGRLALCLPKATVERKSGVRRGQAPPIPLWIRQFAGMLSAPHQLSHSRNSIFLPTCCFGHSHYVILYTLDLPANPRSAETSESHTHHSPCTVSVRSSAIAPDGLFTTLCRALCIAKAPALGKVLLVVLFCFVVISQVFNFCPDGHRCLHKHCKHYTQIEILLQGTGVNYNAVVTLAVTPTIITSFGILKKRFAKRPSTCTPENILH